MLICWATRRTLKWARGPGPFESPATYILIFPPFHSQTPTPSLSIPFSANTIFRFRLQSKWFHNKKNPISISIISSYITVRHFHFPILLFPLFRTMFQPFQRFLFSSFSFFRKAVSFCWFSQMGLLWQR